MKSFEDAMRPALARLPGTPGSDKRFALSLYPEQPEMDRYLLDDGDRFRTALDKALNKPQDRESLIPVTHRFLDGPLQPWHGGG